MAVETSLLSNGVRVVSDSMNHLETVSLGVWLDVGARYERPEQNGLSHLLEHLAFKGTTNRTALELAEEVEAVGGYLNAYTSREHTTYYVRLMKDDLPLAVDVLSDIVLNATFDPKELKREKKVVIQEIGQVLDTPDDLIFDFLQETAFPDQSLGRSILGTAETVESFASEDIRAYMQKHYCGKSTVLAAAGNVDHAQLVNMAENYFGAMAETRTGGFETACFSSGEKHQERHLEQLHMALGFKAVRFDDPDYFALQVLTTIYGGGMSSRLFQEVREKRGLAYSVYAYSSAHADTGLFGVYAGTSPSLVPELLPVIAGEFRKLTQKVGAKEMDRAKAQLKASLLMSLESTPSRVEQLGRQMLIFDRPLPTSELIDRVDAISKDDISRIASQVMAGPLAFSAIGNLDHMPDIDRVEEMFRI